VSLTVLASAQQHQQARQFQIRAQETRKSDSHTAPSTLQQNMRARQLQQQQPAASSASYEYSEEEEENVPVQQYQRQQAAPQQRQQYQQQQQHIHPQQGKKQLTKAQKERFEEELEEEEEPDQLALLLAKSQFTCNARTTGYYADDTVGCQVFHYCQDNTKHSWICPEGATFHQVHLICMPPSEENICEQSAKYHFVNDYLYKPINMEEHQSKPNVSLRWVLLLCTFIEKAFKSPNEGYWVTGKCLKLVELENQDYLQKIGLNF
jgi:Chitin binding Peritrophin-A domain